MKHRRAAEKQGLMQPLLANEMPQTSIPHTSMPQTSVPHTSMPYTSAQPQFVSDYSELHSNAPMTSIGVDELEELLHKLQLTEYLESFRAQGFDRVADVALLNEADLRDELGMKLGHVRRLLKHLNG